MFYMPDKEVVLGIALETAIENLETSEFKNNFALLTPIDLRVSRSTLKEIFNCTASDNCRLKSEHLQFSMNKLAEHVEKIHDVKETIKLLVPKGYDMEKYNKSFARYLNINLVCDLI